MRPIAAITRYLAAFLTAHRHAGERRHGGRGDRRTHDPARPDVVLFNGGVFESSVLRQRLVEALGEWFGIGDDADPGSPIVLDNDRLDLAVARGAAYYGMVRRGEGVRIAASLARTYYIGVESADRQETSPAVAVCLVPGSAEPGQDVELADRQFDLLVSEPVEFPLYASSMRLTDRPGELVPIDPEQMTALPPIRTVLQDAQPPRARDRAGAAARPADRDRHARTVVQRSRRRANLAAAVRRALGDADRSVGPRVGGRSAKASSMKRSPQRAGSAARSTFGADGSDEPGSTR